MSRYKYKEKYGIPGPEVENLSKRFYSQKLAEGFYDRDTFLLWCSQNGYKKGLTLYKKDDSLPHSTENSFFADSAEVRKRRAEKFREDMQISNEFCKACTTECKGTGCKEWQDWFQKNWDEKIHVPKVIPPEPEKPMVWRYEHPDLVREGIVFEDSCRV